jgi:hypothetical protein
VKLLKGLKRKRKKKLSTFKNNLVADADVASAIRSSWRSKSIQELHVLNVNHVEVTFRFWELSTEEVTIHIQHKEAMLESSRSFVAYTD